MNKTISLIALLASSAFIILTPFVFVYASSTDSFNLLAPVVCVNLFHPFLLGASLFWSCLLGVSTFSFIQIRKKMSEAKKTILLLWFFYIISYFFTLSDVSLTTELLFSFTEGSDIILCLHFGWPACYLPIVLNFLFITGYYIYQGYFARKSQNDVA